MKYEIMLGILFDLLSKKTVTATYLAEKYEVTVRTIYRYISCLETAGIPLYTNRGKNGGIAIIDTFKLSSTFMTVNEFEKTIAALTSFTQNVPDKTLNSAINKLKASVKNEYTGLNIKSGNMVIDAGPWGDSVHYKSKLLIIQQSIESCKRLKIIYHDRNGEVTERIIEPHVIIFKQGLWYVYAYCNLRQDFRFFKTGRIELATVLNETFTRKDIESLPTDYWSNSVPAENVVIEINKSVLSDVEEWLGIENIEKINDKYFADVKLPLDDGLIYKLLSFGNKITVKSPTSVIKNLKDKAKEIVEAYN